VRECAFELSLCARLEATREAVVARQLGGGVVRPGGRVVDTVLVEPGPEFAERAAITDRSIPVAAVEADVGAGRARRPTAAIDRSPERARAVAERAVEVGFFEREVAGTDRLVRQVTRYPDWVGALVAVENKPDLGSPGAMAEQLRFDRSLALFDRVVLATESHVTGAHLNRLPDGVGVWRFRPDEGIEVVREPASLPVGEAGVEVLERRPGATEVRVVDPAAKARARRRVAERAYGKGWRPEFPACGRVEPAAEAGATVPYCPWKGRVVDPGSDCGDDCPGQEPAEAPEVDADAERAARTPWVAGPEGRARTQAGLDRW
jgi:hypothetical protein